MIQIVGTQYRIEVEQPRWLLLCDETNYFTEPRKIPIGVTWAGKPVMLFESEQEALQHITDNKLVLSIDEEI